MNKIKGGGKEAKSTFKQTKKRVAKVIAADGAFSRINDEICHLLFYANAPFIKNEDSNKIYVGQEEQLQIEVRLPKASIGQIIESLFDNLQNDKQKKNVKNASKPPNNFPEQDAVEVA